MHKYLHLIVALVFFLFAFFQWNDPDAFLWIPVYAIIGIMGILGFYNRYYRLPYLIIGAVLVLWMASYIPHLADWINRGMPSITSTMKAEEPHIEWTREFFGLMLCLIATVYYYLRAKKI